MGGLKTSFVYGDGDFISEMTTPYGTTKFTYATEAEMPELGSGVLHFLEAEDPLGNKERCLFLPMANSDLPTPVAYPEGVLINKTRLRYLNTFYWNKEAFHENPTDLKEVCHRYHWLRTPNGIGGAFGQGVPVLACEKPPCENFIFYNYPGQTDGAVIGDSFQPSRIARVTGSGETAMWHRTYNSKGAVATEIDPDGRGTELIYDTEGFRVEEVRQLVPGVGAEVIVEIAYDQNGRLVNYSQFGDAGVSFEYNADGQLHRFTDLDGTVTERFYNASYFLDSMNGPLAGDVDLIKFERDQFGRVSQREMPDGFIITYSYDDFDRLVETGYPDGTTEDYVYLNLDVVSFTDRAGNSATWEYNGLRQVSNETRIDGRSFQYEWCRCGDVSKITDWLGRVTKLKHDAGGRMLERKEPLGLGEKRIFNRDGTLRTQITTGGRVEFGYSRSGELIARSRYMGNQLISQEEFQYSEAFAGRLKEYSNGAVDFVYTYHSSSSLGGGGLASVFWGWGGSSGVKL